MINIINRMKVILFITLIPVISLFSFSNYIEKSLGSEIKGFIRILEQPKEGVSYSVVLDDSIYGRDVVTKEGTVKFENFFIPKMNSLISICNLPISISVSNYPVDVTGSEFVKDNKFIIRGRKETPPAIMSSVDERSDRKYKTQNNAEVLVFYNKFDKTYSQDEIVRLFFHELLHFYSLGHCYYDMIEDAGAGNPTSKASIDRVMWFSDAGAENYTEDEKNGLQIMYNPIQFKHEIRKEDQANYFIHDTKIIFNKYIKEGDCIVKSPFLDYKLRLQGNSNTPYACFKIMKEREKLDVLYSDDPFYEANFNYSDGILGASNTKIDKFQFGLTEKIMDVRFSLDEIELNEKGIFKLRMYHEFNEDYIHVYPTIQNHTTGITPRIYENRSYTLSENADDYIDFQVADFKISEPMSNSRLESDEFNIKVQPYSEEQKKYLEWGYKEDGVFKPHYQGVKEVWYSITRYYFNEANELVEDGGYIISSEDIENNFKVTIKDNMITKNSKQIIIDKESTYYIEAFCFDEYGLEVGNTMINFNMKIKAENKKGVPPEEINIFVESMKDAQRNDDKKSIYWLELKWTHFNIEKDLALNEGLIGYKGKEFILKLEGDGKELEILRWPYSHSGYELLEFNKLIEGQQVGKPRISQAVWDEVSANYKSEKYHFKLYFTLEKDNGLKGEKIFYPVTNYEFNLRRPISLSSAIMVFKKPKPDTGAKTVWGTIVPLLELDTLRVTVPKYDTEAEYWGGVEVLLDGELSPKITIPPVTAEDPQPEYSETDTTRTYKFVWDFSEQPEGFVTLHARYKNDPLSYSQKKVKVGYSETWEDFEDGMGNWEVKTQYAYPTGLGEENHYWRVTQNMSTNSSELRTSTYGYSSQRFEILSPVIEVPLSKDSVHTFLTFDYSREFGQQFYTGGRSMMLVQVCDEAGNALSDQFYGALYQDKDDFPITGYTLNLPNFFDPNPSGLFGDNYWSKYYFWLNWGDALGETAYHSYSGRKIRLKFIQFYTVEFVGIIDNWDWSSGTSIWNPIPLVLNPPTYTDPTTHHIDNFQVKTYYQINLPPTIDQVADQEVKQHCGWQEINLTGITNGENSIFGDDENLDDLTEQGKSSLLRSIKHIKNVEQREDGSLKITALVEEDKEFKEVVLPTSTKKGSKFLTQHVITVTLDSDNKSLIPLDSLKLKEPYMTGDSTAVLMYRPADKYNGTCNITVRVQDDGKAENGGRDYTKMKFKVNVLPFNPPEYDPPITELENLIEDFEEINIDLNSHFTDVDGDKIYYSASSSNPSLIKISLNGGILNIQSVEDAFGTCNLTIAADDSTGTVPTVIQVAVNIEDDNDDLFFSSGFASQELQLPANFGTKRINIAEQFTNELPSTPVYSVTQTNPAILDAVFEGSELCLTSKTDVTGQTDITVNVAVDTRVISSQIKAVAGNLPPEIIAEIPDIETDANFKTMYINLKDHYTDPNKDWLGYTIKSSQEKVDTYISFYDDQLIIESKANESGVDSLYISIYDGEFTVRDSLKITIGDVDVPVPHLVTPIPDQRVKEDFGRYEIDLNNHFADPAGTGIAYVVDFDSTKVKCSIEDGHILVVKSVKDYHGYAPIMVAIDDGESKINDANFEDCDPKNVVRISEKIKKALTKLN